MEDTLLKIAFLLNALEDPFAFAFLMSVSALVVGFWRREYGLAFFASIALTFALIHVLKSVFEVARPGDALAYAVGYRFPSMHAGIAAAFIGSFASYGLTLVHAFPIRLLIMGVALLLVVFVAWTRLLLGVHQPVDVIVGAGIGLLIALSMHVFIRHYGQH